MKYYMFFIAFFVSFVSSAQIKSADNSLYVQNSDDDIEEKIIPRKYFKIKKKEKLIIYETKVADKSKLNKESKFKGYNLLGIKEFKECNHDSYQQSRVAFRTYEKGILTVKVTTRANCCSIFEAELEVLKDTLNFIYKEGGSGCYCMCCFFLEYQIKTKKNKQHFFKLNGKPIMETDELYRIYPVRFEIDINGDTINRINKYGCRIGIHKIYKEGVLLKKIEYQIGDRNTFCVEPLLPYAGIVRSWDYNAKGQLERECRYIENRQVCIEIEREELLELEEWKH